MLWGSIIDNLQHVLSQNVLMLMIMQAFCSGCRYIDIYICHITTHLILTFTKRTPYTPLPKGLSWEGHCQISVSVKKRLKIRQVILQCNIPLMVRVNELNEWVTGRCPDSALCFSRSCCDCCPSYKYARQAGEPPGRRVTDHQQWGQGQRGPKLVDVEN